MSGYEISISLDCKTEIWRILKIPKDINFLQLHNLIQKLFNFDDYHNWDFEIPNKNDPSIRDRTIFMQTDDDVKIAEVFDEYNVIRYNYDYGDEWKFIIKKLDEINYDKKTALLVDYKCRYSPLEDMGGMIVFDQIMRNKDFAEDVLEAYGLSRNSLSKMDIEKRYKKGSRMIIS